MASCRPTRPSPRATETSVAGSRSACVPTVASGRAGFAQPYPTAGPLAGRVDWTLEELRGALAGAPQRPVYPYVVATVERRPDGRWAQRGSSPNFQGGVVTLCACKHQMRSYSVFRSARGVWVAGVTGSGVGRRGPRHLFYLMYVERRPASQAEMWALLPPEARRAKSASNDLLGDVFEPRRDDLRGEERFRPEHYRPPSRATPTTRAHPRCGTRTSTPATAPTAPCCWPATRTAAGCGHGR